MFKKMLLTTAIALVSSPALAWTCSLNGVRYTFTYVSKEIKDPADNVVGLYTNLRPMKSWSMSLYDTQYRCFLRQDWTGDADCVPAGLKVEACNF